MASEGLSSLVRGLEILDLVQRHSPIKPMEIAEESGLPLSTVYRYLKTLKGSGYLIELDGRLMPSQRLAEPGEHGNHLVRYAASMLQQLASITQMTSVLTVRVHAAALCLDSVAVHPKHRIAFRPGGVRALHAGASAIPLLAYAPENLLRNVLEGDLRRFTSATPEREGILKAVEHTRREGYVVSEGHLTPGMVGFGVPVLVGGRCMCALSLVGPMKSLTMQDAAIHALRMGARQLADQMPIAVMEEAWSGTNE